MNVKRSIRQAGRDTSHKAYVMITIVIMIIVLPHLYDAWCAGWGAFP